ncbi:MAG: hypothetical protein KDD04_01220 [Sinomicrobium sp.]|nr:hypothetical protein [Sinomicrobium sp.]
MNEAKILELFFYLLPAIVTGIVSYHFFNLHTKSEYNRRQFFLRQEAQKSTLPLRLQAYERMTLFLERINLPRLLMRVAPDSFDKDAYETLLIRHIETEFDHNLAQQVYISEACWSIIKASKNATIQLIRKTNMSDRIDNADKLRAAVMNNLLDKPNPVDVALNYIKKEVSELL